MTDWSATKAEMKRRYAEGESAGYIAKTLGVSRGSVLGVCWRADIKRGKPQLAARPAPTPVKLTPPLVRPVIATPRQPDPMVTLSADLPLPSTNGCKWPIGEPGKPGFCFCNKGRRVDRPYCSTHWEAAYTVESQEKRRSRARLLTRFA